MKVKIQVWSEAQQRWRTAYVRGTRVVERTTHNLKLLRIYGFRARICLP